ncbi:MAG: metal ABC transporter permease [Nanobdellota archaeon]
MIYQFLQNAGLVAVLASIAAGIIGTYIVVKRMSLITGSIAHTSFGGLGLAYYLGFNPLYGATLFSVAASFIITYVRKKARERLDTLLSAIWAFGMAVGLIFIFMTPGYSSNLFTYLFGNILMVGTSELWLILVLDIVLIGAVVLFYNSFKAVTFDEEFARVRNLPVNLIYLLLFILIALSVVMLIRIVGIILMIALLTIPAATSHLFSGKLRPMMIWSSLISLVSILSGLFVSYFFDLPTGPVIILAVTIIYIAGMVIKSARN